MIWFMNRRDAGNLTIKIGHFPRQEISFEEEAVLFAASDEQPHVSTPLFDPESLWSRP